jgi:hypothetical protein
MSFQLSQLLGCRILLKYARSNSSVVQVNRHGDSFFFFKLIKHSTITFPRWYQGGAEITVDRHLYSYSVSSNSDYSALTTAGSKFAESGTWFREKDVIGEYFYPLSE